MKKKKWIILIISLFLLGLIPIPTGVYKDGGTREYTALTYKIVSWNRLLGVDGTYSKTKLYPFPLNFFSIGSLWDRENVKESSITGIKGTDDPQNVIKTKSIDSIVDHSVDDGVSYDTALELFYSDNDNDYYFPNVISQYIIVKYKDGTQENAKEAFSKNNIKISHLDTFNIDYIKKEKEIKTNGNPYFNAEVLEIKEKSILVKPDADSNESKFADKISVSLDFISTIPVFGFNVGDRVRVIYNGEIAKTYPAQISKVFVVYLLSEDGQVLSPTPKAEQNVYCGNTQTTIKKDGKEYTFMGGDSVALTELLRTLNFNRDICKCLPDYTVDTEFGTSYGIKLIESDAYVRYNSKQCALTDEQVKTIKKIIENQCK